MTLTGWVCPVCGEANGPFMITCIRGPHQQVFYFNSTNSECQGACLSTTAPCQKHRRWVVPGTSDA